MISAMELALRGTGDMQQMLSMQWPAMLASACWRLRGFLLLTPQGHLRQGCEYPVRGLQPLPSTTTLREMRNSPTIRRDWRTASARESAGSNMEEIARALLQKCCRSSPLGL